MRHDSPFLLEPRGAGCVITRPFYVALTQALSTFENFEFLAVLLERQGSSESLNRAQKDPSDISGAEKYFNQTLDADGNGLVDVSEIVQWVRKVETYRHTHTPQRLLRETYLTTCLS